MEFQDTREIQYFLHEIRDSEESVRVRDDLLLEVLRFHLVVENLLERFMAAKMLRGKVLAEEGRLSFAQKLAVVDAFGIWESNLVDALRQLNALRRKQGHSELPPI